MRTHTMKKYIIKINGSDCLVNKKDTPKNLAAVAKGRKWGGVWYGLVKSKNCLFELDEAKAMVETLEKFNGKLGSAFTGESFTYEIAEA